jgi:hypothetical protein
MGPDKSKMIGNNGCHDSFPKTAERQSAYPR